MSARQQSDEECAVINRAVALRVRELRLERRLSLNMMASSVGVTMSGYHKYESCGVRITAGVLYCIAEGLGVPVDELYSAVGALDTDMEHHLRVAELLGSFHAIQNEHLRRAIIDVSRHLVAAQAEAASDRNATPLSPMARAIQDGQHSGALRRTSRPAPATGTRVHRQKRSQASSAGPGST